MGVLDMKEDFVSFSLAKKLKEKGYTLDTAHHYDDNGGIVVSLVEFDERCVYPCPEIHQVLKWLREEKKLHIEFVAAAYGYNYIVSDTPEKGGTDRHCSIIKYEGPNDGGAWDEYEAAAIAGIEYCLDNLI